jgi:hypothetical protein
MILEAVRGQLGNGSIARPPRATWFLGAADD